MTEPFKPSENGRNANGQFAPGWKGGPGRPPSERAMKLRKVFLDEITDDDIRAIVQKLLFAAKGGDMAAIRDVLDRIMGRAMPADVLREIDEMMQRVKEVEREDRGPT